jgi:hypothetical protein
MGVEGSGVGDDSELVAGVLFSREYVDDGEWAGHIAGYVPRSIIAVDGWPTRAFYLGRGLGDMTDKDRTGHSRRAYLAGAGGTALAGVAGCLDFITGGPAEFSASPSQVPQDVLDQTGYELDGVSDQEIEREFEAGGESRTVKVTNKIAEHNKSVQLPGLGSSGRAAIFTALTTPKVEILGKSFNPVKDMSNRRIARMVQQQYDTVAAPSQESESTVTINGEETTQTRFRADAQFEGSAVELSLHLTEAVELGSDFLITVGGYPTVLSGEEENIFQLMQAVEDGE